jgi:hypothetical protein
MALDETKPAGTDKISTLDTYGQEERVEINLNTTHRTSDGSDHTFLDQDVTTGSTPTLTLTNCTGLPDAGLVSGATATSAGAGDAGKLIKLDASGLIDATMLGASTETTDLAVTGLVASELIRLNAGGTALESSGKTVPTGDIVGLTDTQTLTNKTLTAPQINDTSADHQYIFGVSELAADRTVTLPLLTGNDEFTFNDHTQTLTNKTLTSPALASPVMTTPQINDTSADHQYIFAVSELIADRTVTMPLLTGNDEFTFNDHTQTLTNKTLTSPVLTTPQVNDTSADHQYIFAVSELVADRTVTLPLLTGNDEFTFNDHTQTLTNKTLTAPAITSPVLTTPQINDSDTSHQYIFAVGNLAVDRTITLPALANDDTFVFLAEAQTLTNKTLTSPTLTTPTIASFTNATHDHADAAGGGTLETTDIGVTGLTVSELLRVNAGGTAIESSGKTVPTGAIVGTTDAQTLTNKTVTSLTSDGVNGHTNVGAPGGALTDGFYMWSQDIVAGNAAPHFYTEEGVTIKLYQVAHADQAVITPTTVGANTGTSGAGLSLIGDTTAVNQASNIMNDFVAVQEDIDGLNTLVESIRTALIAHGLIKGSA